MKKNGIFLYALTDSKDPNDYWYKLKIRVNEESRIELSTICRQLKLPSKDGKNIVQIVLI